MAWDAPDTGMATTSKKPKRSTLLCDVNPHPRDGVLTFTDWDPVEQKKVHYYTITATGERVRKSMTGILGERFDRFDEWEAVNKWYDGWKDDPEGKYYTLIHYLKLVHEPRLSDDQVKATILQTWEALGDDATTEGTAMHQTIEDFLNGVLPPPGPGEDVPFGVRMVLDMMDAFYPEQQLEPWRVEFPVLYQVRAGDHVEGLRGREADALIAVGCGLVDALFRSKKDGRIWMLDWKRVNPKKKSKGLLGVQTAAPFRKFAPRPEDMALAPFHEWEAKSFHKYSAQLLGYRHMLIAGGYFTKEQFAGCFLVQMHEKHMPKNRAHVVEAADMHAEVAQLFADETALAVREWSAKRQALASPLPPKPKAITATTKPKLAKPKRV